MDNIVLVVVGDLDIKSCKQLILEKFNSPKSQATKIERPAFQEPQLKGIKINYAFEKDASNTRVQIDAVKLEKITELNFEKKRQLEITRIVTTLILTKRFREIVSKGGAPFESSSFHLENNLEAVNFGSISVSCKPDKWKESLSVIEKEIRRTLQFGFFDIELEQVKKYYISKLDNGISKIGKVESRQHMNLILESIAENKPFLDAFQVYELEMPLVEKITKEDVLNEFNRFWLVDHRIISISGNVLIKDADNEIKKTYEESQKSEK